MSAAIEPEFLSLRDLATHSGLSRNTLRKYVDADPSVALPSYRPGGKILVRRTEFDAWLEGYRTVGRPRLIANLHDLGLAELSVKLGD